MKLETALCHALAGVMEKSKTVNMRHPWHDHEGDGVYEPGCAVGHLLWMKGIERSREQTGEWCINLLHTDLGLPRETCRTIYRSEWTETSPGAITGPEVAAVLRRAAGGEEIPNVYRWAR